MKPVPAAAAAVLFLAGLLCFPGPSLEGASAGLLLWFRRVLPVLLPFVLASRLMTASRLPDRLSPRTCGLLMGFLCGYPVGALWAASLTREGRVSRRQGQRMLLFCNQPSPMFLTGYLGVQCLGMERALPVLLCASAPALAGALLFLRRMKPAEARRKPPLVSLTLADFETCFLDACVTLTRIGGYILVFSILASWAALLPLAPVPRAALLGLCEMTTGLGALGALDLPLSWAGPLGLGLAVFGGLSCLGQTAGCVRGSGLRLGPYALGRLLLGLASAGLFGLDLRIFSGA